MPQRHRRGYDSYAAWKCFVDGGTPPAGNVPGIIVRSWRRCALGGMADSRPPDPMSSSVLAGRIEAGERLRQWVQPEIEALAEELELTRSIVLLSDAEGVIFHSAGGLDFTDKAERVALRPGACWAEADRGTNAIGTAIAERQSVEVRGAEHYLQQNHLLYCAAAPIHSPRGRLLGVLDISGDARDHHGCTMGLLRWAVQMIERRAALDCGRGEDILHFHADPNLAGSHREGLIILRDGRIRGASPKALRLLGTDWKTLLGADLDSLFERTEGPGGGLAAFRTWEGQVFYGRLSLGKEASRCFPAVSLALNGAGPPPGVLSAGRETLEDERGFPPEAAAGEEAALEGARRVLDAGVPVLVLGETGVGKEHFARRLHAASRRRGGPFTAVNCGALPETLIDSELFGYEEGAFTGARRRGMPGRVREAHGGVLFLDEIGDMPSGLQARLLRVLQEREVTPLGGRPIPVDFALVCATHRDLKEMVARDSFRADLFYRLQGYAVELPPLRKRPDRAALIERLFLEAGGREAGLSFEVRAFEAMTRYEWPGNIRELQNVLRTLVALAEPGAVIRLRDLPPSILTGAITQAAVPVPCGAEPLGHERILRALKAANGCVTKAAQRLGVHRSTIYRHLSREDPGSSSAGEPEGA